MGLPRLLDGDAGLAVRRIALGPQTRCRGSGGPGQAGRPFSRRIATPLTRAWVGDGFVKGVLLAGGTGSRLHPLTLVTNKHLMPVHDRPMIYFPLQTLRGMGIEKVMVILG